MVVKNILIENSPYIIIAELHVMEKIKKSDVLWSFLP